MMASMSSFVGVKDTCPKCKESFDVELSLMNSNEKHHLPFTCNKCFLFTLCGACFNEVDWSTFTCPICHKKQGFDRDDPIPNRLLCSIFRENQQQAEVLSHQQQPVVVSPAAASDKIRSTNQGAIQQTSPKRTLLSLKIAASTARARGSAAGPNTKKPSSSRKKKQASVTTKFDCKVGDRVYCLWPDNKRWYWGHIKKIYARKKNGPFYKVKFDDGDVRDNVRWNELVTEEQYNENDSTKRPEKKKAKLSQGTKGTDRRKPAIVDSTQVVASLPLPATFPPPSKESDKNKVGNESFVDDALVDGSTDADSCAFYGGSLIPSNFI